MNTPTTSTHETNLPDLKDAQLWADTTFNRLLSLWNEGLNDAANNRGWLWDDFWKAGNTLDCVLNYLVVRQPANTKVIAPDLLNRSLTNLFDKLHYPSNPYHWRDDYGWWGNALMTAYTNAEALGIEAKPELKERCLRAAIDECWNKLKENAEDNRNYKSPFDRSMFGEGYAAWNDHNAHDYEYDESGSPRVKPEETYMPVPNSVTNFGFWALSIKLFEELDNKDSQSKYLESMRDTTDWLNTYDSRNLMFNHCDLINETPNPEAHKYWCAVDKGRRDRAWTADQGAFLYCVLKTLQNEPPNSPRRKNLEGWLERFAIGFLDGSNTLIDKNKVLREYDFNPPVRNDDNSSNFNDNYCTGPGVLMRYLGYAMPMLTVTELKPYFTEVISASAESAWNCKLAEDQIRCWWDKYLENTNYFSYFSQSSGGKRTLWDFAFQTAALDLFVALLRLYQLR